MNLIKVNGWNAYVHLPSDYEQNSKSYPTILFIPGLGEVGSDANRLIQNGPGAYIKQGWNGEALGVKFIVISLQPSAAWPGAYSVKQRVDELKRLYSIGDLYMTGLSMGGWASMSYATTYPTELKGIVSVEGVDIGYGTDISQLWKAFAQGGGKMVNFEQRQDYRLGDKAVAAMNSWAAGSAVYIETNFGSGGHCCWNEFYGGVGKQPGRFDALGGKNLYEWIANEQLKILPEFITKANLRNNILSWECENVQDNDLFLIEESTDGKNFKPAGQVLGRDGVSAYKFEI